ncbi:hypothetical protein MesoLj113a_02050 [Mesorhizobium sp. 113-1-2]|jgi:hypothetical protein|uniref:hypothetical protein n=1 Tax=Mesorhizobium sp. 113-1-2 TaxID=2744515 RepID=UPI0008199F87|nr:hypothetical protein [Mesorhizobium sp. 113-1-2]BAV49698.1 Chromosome undetermined scaffold_12, whole genome shotgun sequence [Mesorhizobium loti]BCG69047.1 hypothetical protein MesoLj113a_02050 [Mesorhizobium sp. 113-1-2]
MILVFQSLVNGWRRFWSRKLIAKYKVNAQYFTVSFNIYQSDDGERMCRMSVVSGEDSSFSPMRKVDLELLIEAAQEARSQLGDDGWISR